MNPSTLRRCNSVTCMADLPVPSSLAAAMTRSHDHHHAHDVRAGARHKGRLFAALVVLGVGTAVEGAGGFPTNSLALLSAAGHMLTDMGGLGMALAAVHVADRARVDRRHSFGLYRLQSLGPPG